MPITYNHYGKLTVFGTFVDTNASPSPSRSEWRVTKLTSNSFEFNLDYTGLKISLSYLGQFNLDSLTRSINNVQDFDIALARGEISAIVQSAFLTVNGENAGLLTANPALPYVDIDALIDSTNLAALKRLLAGNDVFITSSTSSDNSANYLYGGNDTFYHNHPVLNGRDTFFGGDGVDTAVVAGSKNNFTVIASKTIWDQANKIDTSGFVVTDTTKKINTLGLSEVERLRFADGNLALDIGPTQNAGSVYMLYKAAFNRAPDAGGMGYWLAQKDGGSNIVTNIAQGFVASKEFTDKYGTNPTNASYVDKLYQNVLGRAGESGGVTYWNQELDAGRISKAAVLVQFATLPEGASLVANLIANGIAYTEWVG